MHLLLDWSPFSFSSSSCFSAFLLRRFSGFLLPPDIPLWFRLNKNRDMKTGPLACLLACLLKLLTHLLACTAHPFTCSTLLSFICSLACSMLTHSQACGKVKDSKSKHFAVLNHKAYVQTGCSEPQCSGFFFPLDILRSMERNSLRLGKFYGSR